MDRISEAVADDTNIDARITALLDRRGISGEDAVRAFLTPSLSALTPIERYRGLAACRERIVAAIAAKEKVVVYGDYDCDGVCATAIMYLYLKSCGIDVDYFLPNRREGGYGLSDAAIENIAEAYSPDLLITVDCGITAAAEVEYAAELGIDVVVTDHHEPQEILPDCPIFDPKSERDVDGAFCELCGAGVVLRLVEALAGLPESKKYYDIAALATVADVVPLVGDNRIITYFGLKSINAGLRKGIKLLAQDCCKGEIKARDIAFRLAPRINAAGRIGDANKAVGLFCEDDIYMLTLIKDEITVANETRRTLTEDLYADVKDILIGTDFDENRVIVLYRKYWDEGVLGLAAARIAEDFHRPTILFTSSATGNLKGSGRSVDGINLFDLISHEKVLLDSFGGHAGACGVGLGEEKLEAFKNGINDYCRETYSALADACTSDWDIECEIPEAATLAKNLRALEPFGEGNELPKCKFTFKNARASLTSSGKHITINKKPLDMIGFGMADRMRLLASASEKSVVAELGYKIYANEDYADAAIVSLWCENPVADVQSELRSFLSKALSGERSIFKPTPCTDIGELISGGDFGVCVLTDDFVAFEELGGKFSLKRDVYAPSDVCPYNRIIYCAESTCDLRYYHTIIFAQRCPAWGFVDDMQLGRDTRVFYLDDESMLRRIKQDLGSYEELGRVFTIMKSRVGGCELDELSRDIVEESGLSMDKVMTAIFVFIDLGIAALDGTRLKIDYSVKNKLSNSRLYRRLSEESADNGAAEE